MENPDYQIKLDTSRLHTGLKLSSFNTWFTLSLQVSLSITMGYSFKSIFRKPTKKRRQINGQTIVSTPSTFESSNVHNQTVSSVTSVFSKLRHYSRLNISNLSVELTSSKVR